MLCPCYCMPQLIAEGERDDMLCMMVEDGGRDLCDLLRLHVCMYVYIYMHRKNSSSLHTPRQIGTLARTHPTAPVCHQPPSRPGWTFTLDFSAYLAGRFNSIADVKNIINHERSIHPKAYGWQQQRSWLPGFPTCPKKCWRKAW